MGADSAHFLDLDRVSKTGSKADIWVLVISDPPYPIGDRLEVADVEHEAIDCVKRTYTDLGSKAFDEAGEMVVWLPAARPERIKPGNAYEFIARVVCDGLQPPSGYVVRGHAAALQLGRRILRSRR
jgi:hypothetical protein